MILTILQGVKVSKKARIMCNLADKHCIKFVIVRESIVQDSII